MKTNDDAIEEFIAQRSAFGIISGMPVSELSRVREFVHNLLNTLNSDPSITEVETAGVRIIRDSDHPEVFEFFIKPGIPIIVGTEDKRFDPLEYEI